MWLSLCVLALLLSGAEAVNITIRTTNPDANVQTAARFVGLAYNLLKADPDAAGGGGVDPGFRTTRRVVDLDDAHQESFPRYSCVTASSTSTVYDEKSFQKKFDMSVAVEVGVNAKLVEAKFGLSTSFSDAKDQTTKEKVMTMETQTLCNLGGARLKTELNSHKASQGFRAAVCQLPDAYDQAAYVRFIDDWGTNFVEEVDVGIRIVSKKSETFSSVYQSLQKQFAMSTSASASYSGAIVSVSGSIEMNMNKVDNSQQLKESFKGSEMSKTIGTDAYPEPIKVKIGNIEALVNVTYFPAPNPSACTAAALSKLATKKANLARALGEYPAAKLVTINSSDGKVRIPLSWPKGTYGLLKPKGNCPAGWANNGQKTWDCEDSGRTIVSATTGHHIDGYFTNNIQLKFCVKTNPLTTTLSDTDWPAGEYCLYQYRECPAGFTQGSIYWDDEDDCCSINSATGTVPDGVYNKNTLMYFCCRNDGYGTLPIFLPTDTPFYLLQSASYGCQQVYGMNVASEEVQWDDEDDCCSTNKATGTVPYNKPTSASGGKNWRLYFCYYTKA